MSTEQLCTLFNIVGVLVPVCFSIGIAQFHQEPYFRSWTISYALLFLVLALEVFTQANGHPLFPTVIEVGMYLVSGWYCLKMGDELMGRARTGWPEIVLGAAMLVAYLAGTLAGLPFDQAFMPTIFFYIATQIILGVHMVRSPERLARAKVWMGSLVIATGLWVLAYPILVHAGYVSAGFVISGVLHLVLGMGMMLFLLSDIAFRLQRHNDELKVVERLQGEFIGNMNHEFRTPLNAIRAAAWFLASSAEAERLSERQRETVGIVATNVERVIGLVNDVLDYSKIESGTMTYEHNVTDLNALLDKVVGSLSQLFETKGIELALELPDEAVIADVDARRIEQVVANLLSNALKFTRRGGHVSTRLAVQQENARIEVCDSGVGIAPENLERVFTKFYQVDGSTTRKAGGTGLGLSICKAIIEDGHKGRIWAERAEVGVTFVATIPL